MKEIKFFISVVFVAFVFILNAQNEQGSIVRLDLVPDTNKIVNCLKAEISKGNVDTFLMDTCTVYLQGVKNPKTIDVLIKAVKSSVKVNRSEIDSLPIQAAATHVAPSIEQKYDSAIDEFLNIEDESIFSDEKFLFRDKTQIHPRSYKYYCLISDIYQFRKKMDEVGQLLAQLQIDKVKSELKVMYDLRERIYSYNYEIDCMTESQKEYFNKLDIKYDEIRGQLNLDK